ncbi:hypothetical protein K456DRAFT_347684 [Colletotrichum gloeosporioides 23]|nr:hypothetical protein K456DRAFT_347684 [Colletotrichum gloeosporioides 23]
MRSEPNTQPQPHYKYNHQTTKKTINQFKLLRNLFIRRFFNKLTCSRIVTGVPTDATSPLARLSPWPTTTTPTRFLLDLSCRLSLRLNILCLSYSKTSSVTTRYAG